MITRVVLGTDKELLNISDVQEVSQNTGEYIKRALTINVEKDSNGQLMKMSDIESLLREANALSSIKIYKLHESTDGEYLESEHTSYSIFKA